ncbi:interleukin-17F-like [Microcaecilia unicolor]|uniref:Interleukin-17F-like n=1 Tax=Microcaecilia unicolor TaxID=1415580 RepID=A0A6P7X5V7_9AMPH|nr:interleukin-17F-like [Microcaecilia unicolor]
MKVRSTLLMLLLAFALKSSVSGKVLPSRKIDDSALRVNNNCTTRISTKLPEHIKVDIRVISSSSKIQPLGPDVKSRSLSPWDYSYDTDPHRFPSKIAEAKCQYNRCLNSKGEEDINTNSIPIKQEIMVLRWEMKGCNQVYKLEKKMIAVGCTCVKPITHSVK